MGLLGDLAASPLLARRILVELRGIRRALERQADVAELQAQIAPGHRQAFRGFSREKERTDGQGTEVSYVNEQELTGLLARSDELKAILGRDPTDAELERAFRGEIE
jgi:hypothetical protein